MEPTSVEEDALSLEIKFIFPGTRYGRQPELIL